MSNLPTTVTDGTPLFNTDNTDHAANHNAANTLINAHDAALLGLTGRTKRVTTIASSATPTPNWTTDDEFVISALAVGATFAVPAGGVPNDGQQFIARVKDNGTPQAILFNGIYRFSANLVAPSVTVASKTLYLGFIYNLADTHWDCIAILGNF